MRLLHLFLRWWCSTLWGGSGPCNCVCTRSLSLKPWQLAEMGSFDRCAALVWCSWSWLVQYNCRQKLPKLPVVQCWAFRWTFRRPCDVKPCTLRLHLVPAMSNRGFDALGAWFWLGEGCRLICATTTTTTTFPNPTIDLSSFFLLALADERIGSHNHSKGVVPFVSNW